MKLSNKASNTLSLMFICGLLAMGLIGIKTFVDKEVHQSIQK